MRLAKIDKYELELTYNRQANVYRYAEYDFFKPSFIRIRLREEGFLRKIFPPQLISKIKV